MILMYTIILSVLCLIMLMNIIYVWKKQAKYERNIIRLLGAAIISSAAYIIFINSQQMKLAVFFNGTYYFMCDVLCYFMLKFVEEYTEFVSKKSYEDKFAVGIIFIESISFLLNNKTQHLFIIQQKTHANSYAYYVGVFRPLFYLHLIFCYVLVLTSFGLLIYKIKKTEGMYRHKYILILIPFILLIVINAICYSFGLPIDGSIVLYGITSTIISICAYAVVPNLIVEFAKTYVMENVSSAIICFDNKNNCIYMNSVVTQKIENSSLTENRVKEYFIKKNELYQSENMDTDDWEEDVSIDGEDYVARIRYQVLRNKKNQVQGYFFVTEDRTKKVRLLREEKYRADYDSLTGLYNKRRFFQEADWIIKTFPDSKKWLIVSDIRNFKLINNIFGEKFGDEILIKQAELVKQHSNNNTICGRISGDRFAMLSFSQDFQKSKFEDAVRELEKYTMAKKYRICYHIGLYDITGLTEPTVTLYNRVNLALATIRDNYDQIFVECNHEIIDNIVKENDMINYFETAIKERQFVMYLQPQINLQGKAVGAEALVRWVHPQKGMIFPDQFIDVFEKAGIIHRMDLSIWNQAGEKLAEWKNTKHKDKYISVNISTKDFYYLNVYEELTGIVERNDIDPKLLKLEITESALMMDQHTGFSVISQLREYGFDVEIDDFGSGYSSLNMLKEINVDVLKIDRIFLKETTDRQKSKIILETVISMAKKMGMSVVTEGVETENQVKMLTEMGTDIFQGYYFDKPMCVEEFEKK